MSDTGDPENSQGGAAVAVPFVILAEPRTGSNLLAGMLAGRDDVLSVGELFNPSEEIRQQNAIRIIRPGEDPAGYLAENLYGARNKASAGFRFFYKHAESWPAVCSYLRDSRVHVIHLIRRNPVDRYVSEQIARETGEWILPLGGPDPSHTAPGAISISIDPDDLIQSLTASAYLRRVYRDWFSINPMLEISFERLIQDIECHADSIQKFLGLAPTHLEPATRRQPHVDKLSMVSNIEEVMRAVDMATEAGTIPAAWRVHFPSEL